MLKVLGNRNQGFMLFFDDTYLGYYAEEREAEIAYAACKRLLSHVKST